MEFKIDLKPERKASGKHVQFSEEKSSLSRLHQLPSLTFVSTGESPTNTNTCPPTFYLFAHKIKLPLAKKTEHRKEERKD